MRNAESCQVRPFHFVAGFGPTDRLTPSAIPGAAMGLLRWFTKNWADTSGPSHSDLYPVTLPLAPVSAIENVKRAAATLPHWRVESEASDEVRLTRRTRAIGFVDDVVVTIKPAGPGTILHATSRSRVGIGDLGQNRRNILELWAAIRANS